MDKKSNRTDLLAAGRKKLQQYRQKKDKDGKAKDGKKSSSKADKHQHSDPDPSTVSAVDMTNAESSQVLGTEIESAHYVDSNIDTQQNLDNLEGPFIDFHNDVHPPGLDVMVGTSSNQNSDSNAPSEGRDVEIVAREVEGSVTSAPAEFNDVQVRDLSEASDSAPQAASDAEMLETGYIQVKRLHEGDQETDSSDPKRSDVEMELGRDETPPDTSIIAERLMTLDPKAGLDVCDERYVGVVHVESHITADEASHGDPIDNQTLCPGVKTNSLDLVQLAEVVKWLPEGDFRYLLKSRAIAGHANIAIPESGIVAYLEVLQEQLYLANICKDFFRLQLLEQHEQQSDDVLTDVPAVTSSHTDSQECSNRLSAELAQCRSELEVVISEKLNFQNLYNAAMEEKAEFTAKIDELKFKLDESVMRISILSEELASCKVSLEASQVENEQLQNSFAFMSEQRNKFEEVVEQYSHENKKLSQDVVDSKTLLTSLEQEITNLKISVTDERKMWEEEKGIISHEKKTLSEDLEDCRRIIAALQKENSCLNTSFAVLTEESTKLKDQGEFLVLEFERLSTELVVYQEKVSMQHQVNMQLECELKEVMSRLEQMAEENIVLQSSLEIYKARVAEYESRQMQLSSVETGSRAYVQEADTSNSMEDSIEDAEAALHSVAPAAGDVSEGTSLLRSDICEGALLLKGYLGEADKMMQKLGKLVDGMHSNAVALSHSSGKTATPGVSKLIQAFESKANVDDQETVESASTESVGLLDPYLAVKEQISCLLNILKALAQNAEQVESMMMEENSRCKAAVVTCGELEVEVETLKVITNTLETRNIELEVICGAMNQHAHDAEAKKIQLEDLCEALKMQYEALQLQYTEVVRNLTVSRSKITELLIQSEVIRKSSLELVSTVANEVEVVQREMMEDIFSVEREWKSAFAELVPMVRKLDTVIASAITYPLPYDHQDLDAFGHFIASASAACEVIESLKAKLEARDELFNSYREVEEKLHVVEEDRNSAVVLLQKFSAHVVDLLSTNIELLDVNKTHMKERDPHNLLDAGYYEAVVAKLGKYLSDMLQLKEANSKLSSDLLRKANEVEELSKRCLDTDALLKLVWDVNEVLQVQCSAADFDKAPVSHLESSVLLLIQRYKELEAQVSIPNKEHTCRGVEFDELQEKVESMNSLILQQQNDILVLRESLVQAKLDFDTVQVELLQKVKELEQSELRVASVREKLSIAVAKGKGLVVQRDGLKQSLAEMSSELEKCCQELQLKDSRILEVEEKLKNYSEAGERMEALESELTYIRNSATALRESFLMKDSTLQRIEEILEDLDLPDHFHSKDIIEKVDWLSKTVAGTYLPPSDWDQRSSVGGGSFSDSGLVVADGSKDDVQPTSNVEDLRMKYEELQAKFYELAEQNDMLEQSLTERNILVQRWEEILDRINTPTQIRSMEPEERIHWLGTALSEADQHMRSLQQKIENLENYCESLSNDLEESQSKIYELESSLEAILHEKDSALSEANNCMKSLQQKIDNFEGHCGSMSADLENSQIRISELESSLKGNIHDKEILLISFVTLSCDHEIALETVAQYELELNRLKKEADVLQGNLIKKYGDEDLINQIESDLKRLQSLILDALQDSVIEDESSDVSNIQVLENLIIKLVNCVRGLDAGLDAKSADQRRGSEHMVKELLVTEEQNEHIYDKDVDRDDFKSKSIVNEEENIEVLKQNLSEALDASISLKEERDLYWQKNQSLVVELQELGNRKKELQDLLSQEEQKSASLRDKLNLAVRKGKSLVQQRDGLKQSVEEMTAEIDRLKSMVSSHEGSLVESDQKISDLSLQIEMYKAFEAENATLKNRLIETEEYLQQNSRTLSLLLTKLGEINAGEVIKSHDPVTKLEGIVEMCSDLQQSATIFEQEAKKSKKSAELLLAELNEVQERNDGLQEELERALGEISIISKERDLANSAKVEALSHLRNLSEERENQLAELERLKSSVLGVKSVFFEISTLSDDVFAKDIEELNKVRALLEPHLELDVNPVPAKVQGGLASVNSRFKGFWSKTSAWGNKIPVPLEESAGFDTCEVIEQHLQQLTETINEWKDRVHSHSMSLRTEAEWLSANMVSLMREFASQRSSLDSIKGDNARLESILKEKDMEGVVMRRSISLLYEACTSSVIEIENRKAQLLGETFNTEDLRISFPTLLTADGGIFSGVVLSSSEESVKCLADKLLVSVKDILNIGTNVVEDHSKEMKATILDLQKELQEKDIQRERIYKELVGQIKAAEATAANYSRDLQSIKNYAHDLENELEALKKDKSMLEQRVADLQKDFLSSTELGEKVKSLTNVLTAKEQEIEALMQALEEEENQMETLRSKIEELEKVVHKKSTDLEHSETSRAKALRKLSVTVSKFDELHQMSEGLLSEIENLRSQLQERDAEISFLRKEVTRCTNDVLEVTKSAKERSSGELHEFLSWLDTKFSGVLKREVLGGDGNVSRHPEYKECLQEDITSLVSELEELRTMAQSKDTLLQVERNKIEELLHSKAALEASLHEKELHINSLQGVGASGLGTSEIIEVEPVLNNWTSSPVISSQVRSLRKVNNDQVSIAIDTDPGSTGRIEDEEDDKVHGFKSLTTSRFVPKFTRPVNDMIDGLWVSCDRALMRQPALRLGIMIYWALLHAFLASFIV